jgi:hypothetical protein
MTLSNAQDVSLSTGKFLLSLIWHAAPWIFLWAALGFIVAIILTVYLAKRNLLKRHDVVWNLCAKLGYVVILLALPIGAGVLSGVYTVHNKVSKELDSGMRPIVAGQLPALRTYLADQMRQAGSTKVTSIKEMLKPFKQHFSYVATSEGRWERFKRYCVNDLVVEPTFTTVADTIEKKLLEKLNKAGAAVAGDDERSRLIFALGAAVLVKQSSQNPADAATFDREITQVVMDNLSKRLDQAFSPLYMTIALTLLGMALLIVLEIVLYRRFYWPGRLQLDGPAATGQPLAG